MINIEYIIDNEKSLLTIEFNKNVLKILKVKTNDFLNFYQSNFDVYRLIIFKSDTGYRIKSIGKGFYLIQSMKKLVSINECVSKKCTYFIKKNGSILLLIKDFFE